MLESVNAVLNGPATAAGTVVQSSEPAMAREDGVAGIPQSEDSGSRDPLILDDRLASEPEGAAPTETENPPAPEAKMATLAELETRIRGDFDGSWTKAESFREIQSRNLYPEAGCDTFEEYCKKQWGLTYRRVKQCMDSFDVRNALNEFVSAGELPLHEFQVRPLTALKSAEKQAEAWKEARAKAEKGQPTGEQVAEIVKKLLGKPAKPTSIVLKVERWIGGLERMHDEVAELNKTVPGLAGALRSFLAKVKKAKKLLETNAKADAKAAAKAEVKA